MIHTHDLTGTRLLAMLGSSGAGKTFEAHRLADLEADGGRDVRKFRLAEASDSVDSLRRQLNELSNGASSNTCFYLDALDEVMVPLRQAWLVVDKWIDQRILTTNAALRITCRSAVWPAPLASRFASPAPPWLSATARLQPLTEDDVWEIAASRGIDGTEFLEALARTRAHSLAAHPLTLDLLLRMSQTGGLADSLAEVFRRGTLTLAEDRYERFQMNTALPLSASDVLVVAERLAYAAVLTGRDTFDLSDTPRPEHLSPHDLEPLADGMTVRMDRVTLATVGSTGLFDSLSPTTFRFCHRQIAEYLAGKRVGRALPHQAKSLLSGEEGSVTGVAGPLRETAAFAAIESPGVAEWLAEADPEVIGLSDVASNDLRRRAVLGLLERCSRGELADAKLRLGHMDLTGLCYEGAEADLRPQLRHRSVASVEMVDFAIDLITAWRLVELSDDLAAIALDDTALMELRVSAAYALATIGTHGSKANLKQLAHQCDAIELKGLALRCNWPERMTVPELLEALSVTPSGGDYGAYAAFVSELARSGFNATGFPVEGLRWARNYIDETAADDSLRRIAARIACEALRHLDDPSVLAEMVAFLGCCAKAYAVSPFDEVAARGRDPATMPDIGQHARRRLVKALAASDISTDSLLWVTTHSPCLCILEDFRWLLECVCDAGSPMRDRERFLHIATRLPWIDNVACIDFWLDKREIDPVSRVLGYPLLVTLGTPETATARDEWYRMAGLLRPPVLSAGVTPFESRFDQVMARVESDPGAFPNLCQTLRLDPTTGRDHFERFLTRSPGWAIASEAARQRVARAAQQFLTACSARAEEARVIPLSRILTGGMEALWLLLEIEPDWLHSQPSTWWHQWCWYILRELHLAMHGEPQQPKNMLLMTLHRVNPEGVREELIRLTADTQAGAASLLNSLLTALEEVPDGSLDNALLRVFGEKQIRPVTTQAVTSFLLHRCPERTIEAGRCMLDSSAPQECDGRAIHVAATLLVERPTEAWDSIMRFIARSSGCGRCALTLYAGGDGPRRRDGPRADPLTRLNAGQLEQLAEVLLKLFPPESDSEAEAAHFVTPEEQAQMLRNRIIANLGNRDDQEAVDALRRLEQHYGTGHPWLRRVRARAERARRLTYWKPLSVAAIAAVMHSATNRLIRSESDVCEGIRFVVERYENCLRQDSAESVEDLWNTPRDSPPAPKSEEHVSQKVCGAIRAYFERYAVAADREVEIYRRAIPRSAGGGPGSEVDILVQVPVLGASTHTPIRVPIEVKLSHNAQAKTAMQEQLADRYMQQLEVDHGVYLVVWLNAPSEARLSHSHSPRWVSADEARRDLGLKAAELADSRGLTVVPLLIDASLR